MKNLTFKFFLFFIFFTFITLLIQLIIGYRKVNFCPSEEKVKEMLINTKMPAIEEAFKKGELTVYSVEKIEKNFCLVILHTKTKEFFLKVPFLQLGTISSSGVGMFMMLRRTKGV